MIFCLGTKKENLFLCTGTVFFGSFLDERKTNIYIYELLFITVYLYVLANLTNGVLIISFILDCTIIKR